MTRAPSPVLVRGAGNLALAAAATLLYAFDVQSPVRTAIALAFVLLSPGLVLTDLVGIDDPVMRLAVAPSASIAAGTLVVVLLIYTTGFTVARALTVLVALTVAGTAIVALRALAHRAGGEVAPSAP